MNKTEIDHFLSRMFKWRRITLRAGAVFVVLMIGMFFLEVYSYRLSSQWQLILLMPLWISILLTFLFILAGTLVTCYYVFKVGIRLVGPKYAVGHFLICLVLANLLLIGIILIPLLVRADVERLA